MSSSIPSTLNLQWQYDESLGEKPGSAKDVIEVYWNQAERQLSTLQARWCLHALRIYSHPLVSGNSWKVPGYITNANHNFKAEQATKGSWVIRCVQQAEILGWSGQVLAHVRLGFTLQQQEFLSVISIVLDWVPYVHMVKYELTFSEGSCTEQIPGCSVQECTFCF